jgi:hypothetical protein
VGDACSIGMFHGGVGWVGQFHRSTLCTAPAISMAWLLSEEARKLRVVRNSVIGCKLLKSDYAPYV